MRLLVSIAMDVFRLLQKAIHRELGDLGPARSSADQGLRLAQASGQRAIVGILTNTLADACFALGDLATARELYEEGLALWREVGGQQGIEYSLGGLGEVQRADGRPCGSRNSAYLVAEVAPLVG